MSAQEFELSPKLANYLAVLPFRERADFLRRLRAAKLSLPEFLDITEAIATRIRQRTVPWKEALWRRHKRRPLHDRERQLWGGALSLDENFYFGHYIIGRGPAEIAAFLFAPKAYLDALMRAQYSRYHEKVGPQGEYGLRTADIEQELAPNVKRALPLRSPPPHTVRSRPPPLTGARRV